MHRIHKGEYGYIPYQKKMTIIRTVICFALCAAIFAIGYITTGTRKNLLTIVAVLGCLPASKSLVNVIMFLRAKGCSEEAHEKVTALSGDGLCQAYDLYMTSYDRNYPVAHAVSCKGSLIGLGEAMDKTAVHECEKHIDEHLKTDGYKNINVKIFDSIEGYTERLAKIKESDFKSDPSDQGVIEVLKAISL